MPLPPKALCFQAVCVSVCDHILKLCEHDCLQTTCGYFTEVTTKMQLGTKANLLNFEVKGRRNISLKNSAFHQRDGSGLCIATNSIGDTFSLIFWQYSITILLSSGALVKSVNKNTTVRERV